MLIVQNFIVYKRISQACSPSQTRDTCIVHCSLEPSSRGLAAAPDELQYFWQCTQSARWHYSWLQNTLVVQLPTIFCWVHIWRRLAVLPSIPQLAYALCTFSMSVSLVGLDWIVQCFTSPPTQYRLYGRRDHWLVEASRVLLMMHHSSLFWGATFLRCIQCSFHQRWWHDHRSSIATIAFTIATATYECCWRTSYACHSVKRDPCLTHQITLTVPRNYNVAAVHVLAALLHTTPVLENDTGFKSCQWWSAAFYSTYMFQPTRLPVSQLTSKNN